MIYFFLFSGSQSDLIDFYHYLNNTDKNINLSVEYYKAKICFLGFTIYRGDDHTLHTTTVTDCNCLLQYESFNPHRKNNIPYEQFQRLRSPDRTPLHTISHYFTIFSPAPQAS